MADSEVVVFKASFPAIKSAILISGDGNGGSIKLEVPELEIDTFRQLIDMRRDELIVTIQRAPHSLTNENGTTQRKSQQSTWAPAEKQGAHDRA